MRKFRVGDIVRPSKDWYKRDCRPYFDKTEDALMFFVTDSWIKERQAEDMGRITESCGHGYDITWNKSKKRNYPLHDAWWDDKDLELVAKHHSSYTKPNKNKDNDREKMGTNFRDFDVRAWGNGDLSMDAKDMQCYIGSTHIGVQTNSKDEQIDIEIENVCNDIRDNFKKLNELLNKIK